jgi:anti-sigma factor RsiW
MQDFFSPLRFWRDHRWAPGHMSAYLDGELPARQDHRMDRHVALCAECRLLLAGLRLLLAALPRLSSPRDGRDPAELAEAVLVRLREAPRS